MFKNRGVIYKMVKTTIKVREFKEFIEYENGLILKFHRFRNSRIGYYTRTIEIEILNDNLLWEKIVIDIDDKNRVIDTSLLFLAIWLENKDLYFSKYHISKKNKQKCLNEVLNKNG